MNKFKSEELGLKPILKRVEKLMPKLRAKLIEAVKAESPKMHSYLYRINLVARIQRERNNLNGCALGEFKDWKIEKVREDIAKKGL